MSCQYQTKVYTSTEDGDDAELDVVIHYDISKGYRPSYMDPGAPDEVFIEKIVDADTGEDVGRVLSRCIASVQLYNNILAEWKEGQKWQLYEHRNSMRDDKARSQREAA